jgi:hypothetical protein
MGGGWIGGFIVVNDGGAAVVVALGTGADDAAIEAECDAIGA